MVGEQDSADTSGAAARVIVADCVVPLADAVTTRVWLADTAEAVPLKDELVEPAGMVRLVGRVRVALLLEIAMAKPPAGAGADIATWQVRLPGVLTLVGEQDSADTSGAAASVTVADCEVPLADTVTTTVWLAATAEAVPLKDALVEPAGMVRLVGRVRFALLLEIAMAKPPAGAGADIAT